MKINITDPIFHDEESPRAHRSAALGRRATCPHCGSSASRRWRARRSRYFLCNDCRDKFTVRTGTVMERSHVPLHKWLLAIHLMAASKKGMSAEQMDRMLGVTYKTAWFLCHRIREAMDGAAPTGPLGGANGVVEADETYVGGKAKNRATRKPAPKKAVVALVERDGRARSFHVANVNAKDVRGLIVTNVDRASALMTDESPVYPDGQEFTGHSSVNHSAKEYVTTAGSSTPTPPKTSSRSSSAA